MSVKSSTVSDLISRIERAPNVTLLVAAYDAALGGSDLSIHRYQGQWQIWHGEGAGFCGSFGHVRTRLAAQAEEILDHEAAEQIASASTLAMVAQPVQQQQACAAPVPSKVSAAQAEVARLEAKCAALREKKNQALALLHECRQERIAAAAGTIDACPAICWTNEERAEAAYDEVCDELDSCTSDYWEALDFLSDEEREDRRASLKDRLTQGPSMVLQPCQREAIPTASARPAMPAHPPGLPTNGWLDSEVAAYVAGVLRELEDPGPDDAVSPISDLRLAEGRAFVTTKAWVELWERDRDDPLSVDYGTLFDARQAMQDAHARLDALSGTAA